MADLRLALNDESYDRVAHDAKVTAAQRVLEAVIGSNADMHKTPAAAYQECVRAARDAFARLSEEGR